MTSSSQVTSKKLQQQRSEASTRFEERLCVLGREGRTRLFETSVEGYLRLLSGIRNSLNQVSRDGTIFWFSLNSESDSVGNT